MPRHRIVVDTNVFVAAGFNPDSHAAAVLHGVRTGRFTLVWDDATRRETDRMLRQIPRLSPEAVAALFDAGERHGGATDEAAFAGVPDPADRKFAALAAAAHATLITNDRHLLDHRTQAAIPILTPKEFLAGVGEAG